MPVPSSPEDFSLVPGQRSGSAPIGSHQEDSPRLSDEEESEDQPFSPADWKDTLRDDFESWLDSMDDIPSEINQEQESDENPDLVTVFGDLSSIALESRKSNRRTSEAFSQWNTVLTGFQEDLKRLRERERVLLENQPPSDSVPAPLASFLVDFHDRLTRLVEAQAQMPAARRGIFGDDTAWKTAWKNQRSALDITLSHLQTILKEQGFKRIHALGQPLDPTCMAVVESRLVPGKEPHTVIGEIAPGWLLGSRVLRPAQVVVAIPPPETGD